METEKVVIKPTVGRVVWFWPSRGAAEPKQQQPYAATVAYVHNDRLVNLGFVDHNGQVGTATSVMLVQPGDEVVPTGYYCEWMPYQKGQAARTDAAEKSALELGAAARALGPEVKY